MARRQEDEDIRRPFEDLHIGDEEKFAYHVTNLESDSRNIYRKLRLSIADDKTYDGHLVGLPVVFFSTTLYMSQLPDISVYPRDGQNDKKYLRVKIPLSEFQGYDWWKMSHHGQQIHLLFTKAKGHWSRMLRKCTKTWFESVDQECFSYLKLNGDQWTVNDYADEKTFVNIAVLKEVKLDANGCIWDEVSHRVPASGHGEILVFNNTDHMHCRSKWIWEKVVGVNFHEDSANKQVSLLNQALEARYKKPLKKSENASRLEREDDKLLDMESVDPELLDSIYHILFKNEE